MTDGQRYAAGVDHEEGLKHDSTICWICAAIALAVEEGIVVASTLWLQALDEVNQTFDLVPIEQIKDKAMEKIAILEADNG